MTEYYIQKLYYDNTWITEYHRVWQVPRNHLFPTYTECLSALLGLYRRDQEMCRINKYRIMCRVVTEFEVK